MQPLKSIQFRYRKARGIAAERRRSLEDNRRGLQFGRDVLWENGAEGAQDSQVQETNLFEQYFDGHDTGPGIWKWRHYFPIYERHLSKFRGRDVHILEIGIYSGGSLGMWKSYFGDGAHIYGVDIAPECRSHEGDGVEIFIGDQSDPVFWEHFKIKVPRVDIIIDDGGHEAFQQIATIEALLPWLSPGGVYLCEDVCRESNAFSDYVFGLSRNLNSWPQKVGKRRPERLITPFQRNVEGVYLYPFVAVIERRTRPLDLFYNARNGTEWEPKSFWEPTLEARRTDN